MSNEIEEFKIEIFELLDNAENALLEFDKLPPNQSAPKLYDEVFRAYHNIKGAAGMMEWDELQHHVHKLENELMLHKENATIPKNLISWFLKGNDVARCIMNNEPYEFNYEAKAQKEVVKKEVVPEVKKVEKEKTNQEEVPSELRAEFNDTLERVSGYLLKFEKGEGDKELTDALYREIHSLKGAAQLFGLVEASNLAHGIESNLGPFRDKKVQQLEKAHVNTLLLCVDLMNQCLDNVGSEDTQKEVEFMVNLLTPFVPKEKSELPAPENNQIEEIGAQVMEEINDKKVISVVSNNPNPNTSPDSDKTDTTIRVQVSLLDRLMTLMGEMVLVRNQVLQYSNKNDDMEFLNLSKKLDVVTSELQEETMKTRMQPIGNILNKFQRVVRDLSGSLNKKINLNLHGVETELDKTLIEAVKDPLTHIVRNSCDHGIESPEDRSKAGKPSVGTITIKAYHEGGQVIVDISDDGKGLSREKLIKKALEKGIIDANKASRLSDREVHALIFAPGFSTAEKVTNVSGRGVGMDVVKSNIEKIGGFVDLSSVEGEGTKITLKIPLTLAIVPAMIIRSDNDRFAIPQVKLVELVRVEKNLIEYVQGRPVYRLRGNVLPLLNLKEILGAKDQNEDHCDAFNIAVLNSDSNQFGMIVDEILDTADIVVKPLARFLKSITIYSGATVLGDGNVAFILDVHGIAKKHLGANSNMEEMNEQDKFKNLFDSENELREFVLVKLGSPTKHAIPLAPVSRMEEFKTDQIEFSGNQKVVRYRGGVLKIINLNDVLNYPYEKVEKEISQVIVVKDEDQMIGLEVDQIIDVLSTRDLLDNSLSNHEAIVGNLVTQNEIVVVVDVEKIMELTRSKRPRSLTSSSKKILLVEDTDSIRKQVSQNLSESGFVVEEAIDGVDGLQKIANAKADFDLIISDIEMPKMNGYELARRIRKISKLKDVPIIAFTTKNTPAEVMEAKDAGFSTYLEKSKGKLLSLLVNECLLNHKRTVA
jgi:two-component system, chemotaxis family, sensor kinase CheA